MRFSEHELTTAVNAAGKYVVAARRKDVRKGKTSVDDVWAALNRHEQYKVLKAVGAQVLPVLAALPDIEVPTGQSPGFSQAQIMTAVTASLDEGAGGRMRRKLVLAGRVAIVKAALAALPPRGGFPTSPSGAE